MTGGREGKKGKGEKDTTTFSPDKNESCAVGSLNGIVGTGEVLVLPSVHAHARLLLVCRPNVVSKHLRNISFGFANPKTKTRETRDERNQKSEKNERS